MTRIILHPRALPRTGPLGGTSCQLWGDWHWWRTIAFPDPDTGSPIHQQYDDPVHVTEAVIEFNRSLDPDTRLADPPCARLLTVSRVSDAGYGDPMSGLVLESHRTECLIVWNGPPGPRWEMLPGNTCRPGDYEIRSVMIYPGDRSPEFFRDAFTQSYYRDQPLLRWPMTPAALFDRLRGHYGGAGGGGRLEDVMRQAVLTASEIRRLEELPPDEYIAEVIDRASGSGRGYSAIGAGGGGGREFVRWATTQMAASRVCFLMLHSGDPGPDGTANAVSERCRTIFRENGELIGAVTWMVPAGTVTHISVWDGALTAQDGQDHLVMYGPLTAGPITLSDPGPVTVTDLVLPPTAAARLPFLGPGGASQRSTGRGARRGNPEQPVLDEIDRLVNDQLRPGPRDDYSRDRYEHCALCGEGWHGLPGRGEKDKYNRHLLGAEGCPGAFASDEEVSQWREGR